MTGVAHGRARGLIRWARKGALEARSWTIFRFAGSDVRRGADFRRSQRGLEHRLRNQNRKNGISPKSEA